MARYTKLTNNIGDGVLSVAEPVQDFVVGVVSQVSEAVASVVPASPVAGVVGEQVPAPAEIAEANFTLASRLLESQRTFVGKLFGALAPLTAKVSK